MGSTSAQSRLVTAASPVKRLVVIATVISVLTIGTTVALLWRHHLTIRIQQLHEQKLLEVISIAESLPKDATAETIVETAEQIIEVARKANSSNSPRVQQVLADLSPRLDSARTKITKSKLNEVTGLIARYRTIGMPTTDAELTIKRAEQLLVDAQNASSSLTEESAKLLSKDFDQATNSVRAARAEYNTAIATEQKRLFEEKQRLEQLRERVAAAKSLKNDPRASFQKFAGCVLTKESSAQDNGDSIKFSDVQLKQTDSLIKPTIGIITAVLKSSRLGEYDVEIMFVMDDIGFWNADSLTAKWRGVRGYSDPSNHNALELLQELVLKLAPSTCN